MNRLSAAVFRIVKKCAIAVFIVACGLVVWDTANAESLNLDFGNSFMMGIRIPSSTFGAASGQIGVWNSISQFSTAYGVVDVNGIATDVTFSITASSMGGFERPYNGSDDAKALVEDNFVSTPGVTWTILVSGLDVGLYDVYLYEPNNSGASTGAGTVNGIAFSDINGNFSGAFQLGSNYHFLNNVLVSEGQLLATGISSQYWSGLSGMQLLPLSPPIPEPSTMLLLGSGLAGLVGYGRRRMKK